MKQPQRQRTRGSVHQPSDGRIKFEAERHRQRRRQQTQRIQALGRFIRHKVGRRRCSPQPLKSGRTQKIHCHIDVTLSAPAPTSRKWGWEGRKIKFGTHSPPRDGGLRVLAPLRNQGPFQPGWACAVFNATLFQGKEIQSSSSARCLHYSNARTFRGHRVFVFFLFFPLSGLSASRREREC